MTDQGRAGDLRDLVNVVESMAEQKRDGKEWQRTLAHLDGARERRERDQATDLSLAGQIDGDGSAQDQPAAMIWPGGTLRSSTR